jgi:hypothetical protein
LRKNRNSALTEPRSGQRHALEIPLEKRHEILMQRLARLNRGAQRSPGYKTARRLLGNAARKTNVATRIALLDAAAFMLDVLEMIPPLI